jgi:nucleotide-binding universal stress UspA family protein
LDGSVGSARGLAWAIDMARALGAEIVAAHVFQLVPPISAAPPPIPDTSEWQQLLRQEFENEWCGPLKNAGVHYRTIFQMGSPAATLIDIARREHADLLVTGTRGVGGFKELMLGSVSHQLVLHATVPVVVIPADVERAAVAPESMSATALAH